MSSSTSAAAEIVNNGVVNGSDTKLEQIFSMKGGKGEASYANNSQAQARHAGLLLPLLKEALDGININSCPKVPFVVADLGCSSGTNTINTIDVIVKHLSNRYQALGIEPPEFSAVLSDLPSNDFNTLFQLLPPLANHRGMEECLAAANGHRSYFASAVPGSFYKRLVPSDSVNFFYSAFSLHWMPQVPESVMDKNSPAYNNGKVFIQGAKQSTAAAYKKQWQSGLADFLNSRKQEIKKNGSMFLVCLGRTSDDPTHQGGPGIVFGTHFEDAWNDMVQEGLISPEKRDSFNVPLYAASLQDFKEVVEAKGSFAINKLQIFKGGSPLVLNNPNDPKEVGRALVNTCRSVCGVLVEAHIGESLSNDLFLRVQNHAAARANEVLELTQFNHIVASLSFI